MSDNDELSLTLKFKRKGEEELKQSKEEIRALAAEAKRVAAEERRVAAEEKKIKKEAQRESNKKLKLEEKGAKEKERAVQKTQKLDDKAAKDKERAAMKARTLEEKAAKKAHDATSKGIADNEQYSLSWLMLAERAVQWVRAHADAAIAAEAFEHHLRSQLELYTKSAPAAQKLFGELEGFGARTGNTDVMGKWAIELQEAKVEGEALKNTLAAMADAKAMGFNPEAYTSAAKSLREMQLAGRKIVMGNQLVDMWKATGLDQERLEKTLGLKGTRTEINRQLGQMKFDVEKGLMILRKAMQDTTGGPLGSKAIAAEDTVENKIGMVSKFFGAIAAKGNFDPITMSIDNMLNKFSDPEVVEMFTEAIDDVAYAASFCVDIFGGLALGTAFLIRTIGRVPEYLGNAWDWVVDRLRDGVQVFDDIGKAITDGLFGGIARGWNAMVDKVKGLVRGLIGGVREELDSHSPSKELEYIGHHEFDAGLERGIERGAPRVEQAARSLASDAMGGTSAGVASGAPQAAPVGQAAGGRQGTTIIVNWNAPSPDAPPSMADELAWRAMFDRVASEWAVAA